MGKAKKRTDGQRRHEKSMKIGKVKKFIEQKEREVVSKAEQYRMLEKKYC